MRAAVCRRFGQPLAVEEVELDAQAEGEVTQCEGKFGVDDRGPLRFPDGAPVEQGLRVGGFAEYVTVHASQVVPITLQDGLFSSALAARDGKVMIPNGPGWESRSSPRGRRRLTRWSVS